MRVDHQNGRAGVAGKASQRSVSVSGWRWHEMNDRTFM
jgi:hypothetical protein